MTLQTILVLTLLSSTLADVDPVCEAGHCEDEGVAMIQLKAGSKQAIKTAKSSFLCTAAWAAYSAYRHSTSAWTDPNSKNGPEHLEADGYTFERGFNHSVAGTGGQADWDYVGWWRNGGDCIFNFQGSDSMEDFGNNYNTEGMTWQGVHNVHTGIATEVEGLLSQVNWDNVKSKCTKVTSIGHSLGGGMAQLFAVAANSVPDNDIDITVDEVYTFGSMALGETNEPNELEADKCFNGQLFWNARRDPDDPTDLSKTQVDTLRGAATGGLQNEPIRSEKTFLFGPDASQHETWQCGNITTYNRGSGYDLHSMALYQYWLGCIDQDTYNDLTSGGGH